MKTFLAKAAKLFGIQKNSKYMKDYLNASNMRSAIFMSAIIIIIEIWMIIRRFIEDLGPLWASRNANGEASNFFLDTWQMTSSFWLLLSLGIAMFLYSFYYIYNKHREKLFLPTLITSIVGIVFVALMPFDKFSSNPWKVALMIVFYASILVFLASVIAALIYTKKGGTMSRITCIMVISAFALACLAFGVRVSYSDFSNTVEHKQIIAFLMMSIYVGCLLIWKPYVSFGILGTVFLAFYFLLRTLDGERPLPDGDVVNYITFFISLTMVCISIYNQRADAATKAEKLEISATVDSLTGLHSFEHFINLVKEDIEDGTAKMQEWVYLFLDITSFKIFNDQKGFLEGNKFLYEVGQILTKHFKDGLITRQSDDHYVVFAPDHDIKETLIQVNDEIEKLDLDIRPGIHVGGYIFRDKDEDPHQSVEKARYACAEIKNLVGLNYLLYDKEMHDNYRLIQHVVHHIDEAVAEGCILLYYQPVVWAEDESICSFEVLARWNDKKYGFLPPDKFIPALENAQLTHKLDLAILEDVCKNLRHAIMNDLPVVPVSINFSRIDFVMPTIIETIQTIVDRNKIPHEYIHIEITESALLEKGDVLKNAIKRLHEKGFSLWLDDFGSGYSSLNSLKDYEFDVLKLDMRFLSSLTNNDKSKALIKSVIAMAKDVGMETVCEGVERKDQAEFLRSTNATRLQGYYYSKPIPYKDMEEKIINHEVNLSKDIKKGRKVF